MFYKQLCQFFLIGLLMATISTGLAACETVEGAGEDIEHLGDAIDDAAEDSSAY